MIKNNKTKRKFTILTLTLLTLSIVTTIFFNYFTISKFNYTGELTDLNGKHWYTYKDSNNTIHFDEAKSIYKILIIDKESYYNN